MDLTGNVKTIKITVIILNVNRDLYIPVYIYITIYTYIFIYLYIYIFLFRTNIVFHIEIDCFYGL